MVRSPFLAVISGALALLGGHAALAYDKSQPPPPKTSASAAPPTTAKPAAKLVDLNRASRSDLRTLPGIGEPEAAKIVAGRPYKSKTDLVTKNVLTVEIYDLLSSRVVVDHRNPPPKAKS